MKQGSPSVSNPTHVLPQFPEHDRFRTAHPSPHEELHAQGDHADHAIGAPTMHADSSTSLPRQSLQSPTHTRDRGRVPSPHVALQAPHVFQAVHARGIAPAHDEDSAPVPAHVPQPPTQARAREDVPLPHVVLQPHGPQAAQTTGMALEHDPMALSLPLHVPQVPSHARVRLRGVVTRQSPQKLHAPHVTHARGVPTKHGVVLELLGSLQALQIPEQLRVRVSSPAPHAELHAPHAPHGLQSPTLQSSVSQLDPTQPPHVPTHARVRL